jgi:diacylglycerol kinase family enzyme
VSQPFLIVDPSTANVDALLPSIEHALSGMKLSAEVRGAPSGVRASAREALQSGARFLVAVGDDATVRDVVSAMMEREDHSDLLLGVIPTRDCDLVRTFGLPQDPLQACAYLTGTEEYQLDIGTAVATGSNGEQVSANFAIVAGVGFGAMMQKRAAEMPRSLGRSRRFLGFWVALTGSRSAEVEVTVGRKAYRGSAYDVVVGNCQFFGGGLRVSPRSYPGDGILDVLVMKGPRSAAFTQLPKMYRGEHVPSTDVVELSGREIHVKCERPLPVHADGQIIGMTPVAFSVEPKALRLKV